MNNALEITQEFLLGGSSRKKATSRVPPEELFSRTPFSPQALAGLYRKKVLIFGAGSGGSRLAVYLAQANVGTICLADPGRLQAHNILRHTGTVLDIGKLKVDVVSDTVLMNNPGVTVEAYPLDLFAEDSPITAREALRGADLILAATDKTEIQLAINALAWEMGIPAVFGGCYESARGGEVLYTLPGEGTPCLACLRAGLSAPPREGPFDYSAATRIEDYQGEPGLSAAVDLITAIEAQIALALLLRGTDSSLPKIINPRLNYLLIGGALGAGYYRFARPFHIFFQPLKGPRPDCPVCQEQEVGDLPVPEVADEMPPEMQSYLG